MKLCGNGGGYFEEGFYDNLMHGRGKYWDEFITTFKGKLEKGYLHEGRKFLSQQERLRRRSQQLK